LRIINNPPRGIGQKTVETLLKEAVSRGTPIWDVISVPTTESVTRFAALISRYHAELQKTKSLVDLVRRLIAEISYEAELKRLYTDPNEQQARWAAVEEVVNALGAYEKGTKKPTLGGFIDEVTLGQQEMGDEKDKQLAKNAVA